MNRIRLLILAGLFAASGFPATAQPLPAPVFEGADTIESTEGHATLSWSMHETEGLAEFELVSSRTEAFDAVKIRYRGPDLASFVSGLPEGKTWFRVRAIDEAGMAGPWSKPLVIDVAYASNTEVFRLLVLGIIVLIATVVTILIGYRSKEVE